MTYLLEFIATASISCVIGYLIGWNTGYIKAHRIYYDQNKWLFDRVMDLRQELDQRRAEVPRDESDWWKQA